MFVSVPRSVCVCVCVCIFVSFLYLELRAEEFAIEQQIKALYPEQNKSYELFGLVRILTHTHILIHTNKHQYNPNTSHHTRTHARVRRLRFPVDPRRRGGLGPLLVLPPLARELGVDQVQRLHGHHCACLPLSVSCVCVCVLCLCLLSVFEYRCLVLCLYMCLYVCVCVCFS